MNELSNNKNSIMKSAFFFITYTVVLIAILFNLNCIFTGVGIGLGIISPILGGIAIAYLLNIPLSFFERKFFSSVRFQGKIGAKIKRPLSIILCFLPLILIICFLIFIVIPQLIASIALLLSKTPDGIKSLSQLFHQLPQWLGVTQNPAEYINQLVSDFSQSILSNIENLFKTLTQLLSKVSTILFRSVLSIVLAVHFLHNKERLLRQLQNLITVFLPRTTANTIFHTSSLANKVFKGFLIGQLSEALILGTLCLFGMLVFQLPYAFLIAAIISISSLIPVIGPIVGTAISAFILLMFQPSSCLWFICFILILQQLEGNFIYPKVVGNSIGLPSIWVISAFIIGGSLFGLLGVLLGIPLAALLYAIVKTAMQSRRSQNL